MVLTVMGTPHPATCWTSSCRNKRTPTLARDQPLPAPWVQGRALDRAQGQVQAATAVAPQLVELQEAEQVSREPSRLDKRASVL